MSVDIKFSVGNTYHARQKMDRQTIQRFAQISGDNNPIHLDSQSARDYGYSQQVAHGAILMGMISKAIGTEIPGPGAVWMNQSMEWTHPIFLNDEIELVVRVEKLSEATGVLGLETTATNQKGKVVMKGKAQVKIAQKVSLPAPPKGPVQRVALVTGGSGGIGAEIAKCLAAHGMAVAINYRESQGAAEETAQTIRSSGGLAKTFGADLSSQRMTEDAVGQIVASMGSLDVVVHGASPIMPNIKVADLRYEDVEPFLRTYVGGALALAKAALPGMVAQKFGRFVFLGTAALFGIPPTGLAAYVCAKEALWGLAKSMATEIGPLGITCNMISPAMTVTDFTREVPIRIKEIEAYKSPLRRLPSPQDSAQLVWYLASDAGAYINGANIPVTGGPV